MTEEEKKNLEQWIEELKQQRQPLLDEQKEIEEGLKTLRYRKELAARMTGIVENELRPIYFELVSEKIRVKLDELLERRKKFEDQSEDRLTVLNYVIEGIELKIANP